MWRKSVYKCFKQVVQIGIQNDMNKEEWYIRKRKIKAFGTSLCFYLCRVFPIKKKLVSVCTFEGKGGFGCNPKYIVQELHKRDSGLEIIWFVNDMSKEFPSYIKKVPNTLWKRAYWLTRSKVWIDNYRTPLGTKKRKGQYYLNTNHYTIGIKTVGLWRGKGFSKMAYIVSKADSSMIDGMIIDSDFCREMCPKGLIYKGNYLNIGAPRLDVLLNEREKYRNKFRIRHGLSKDAKVVMFAPTFREKAEGGVRSVYSEEWSLDFEKLTDSLNKKFGGEWYVCIRVHPQLSALFEKTNVNTQNMRIIDESKADDMYEIMAAMDVYITDYSSACFEAGYAEIPVFIYADDIDKYKNDRGALFWDMSDDRLTDVCLNKKIFLRTHAKFPFGIAINNEMLKEIIQNFDENKYISDIKRFKQDLNVVFDGRASERASCWIEDKLG